MPDPANFDFPEMRMHKIAAKVLRNFADAIEAGEFQVHDNSLRLDNTTQGIEHEGQVFHLPGGELTLHVEVGYPVDVAAEIERRIKADEAFRYRVEEM